MEVKFTFEIRIVHKTSLTLMGHHTRLLISCTIKIIREVFEYEMIAVNDFVPLVYFCTPLNHQKTRGFLMFSGVIESDKWHEID